VSKKQNPAFCLLHAGFLLGLLLNPEDGGEIFFRNFGRLSTEYMMIYLEKYNTS
jgi:hypothetical protein